jgi:hypothetical protein
MSPLLQSCQKLIHVLDSSSNLVLSNHIDECKFGHKARIRAYSVDACYILTAIHSLRHGYDRTLTCVCSGVEVSLYTLSETELSYSHSRVPAPYPSIIWRQRASYHSLLAAAHTAPVPPPPPPRAMRTCTAREALPAATSTRSSRPIFPTRDPHTPSHVSTSVSAFQHSSASSSHGFI